MNKYTNKGDRREKEPRHPEDGSDELVWGINAVREALRHTPRAISELLVQRGKAGPKYQELIDLARANRVKLRFVELDRAGLPTRCQHQGVALRRAAVEFCELEQLLAGIATAPPAFPRLLAIDSIQDPGNLGAILRSALAAGFSSIVVTRERTAPLAGTVARTSAGALSQLRISQVVNLSDALGRIRSAGFWIFGAVAEPDAISLFEADFKLPLCLVIGSEGKGVRPLVRKQCDQLITIPMAAGFDSLNVSAAAAVIMFEAVRQQQ